MVMFVCLGEDNARFILLFALLAAYMIAGAVLFQYLESDLEVREVTEFWKVYHAFKKHHLRGSSVAIKKLHELLYSYGNASSTGLMYKRRRWDFAGSLHFVGTIISTIGYGTTAPQTIPGKIAVILYGFLGCSGGILFFNLFLERIITFLAWVLRSLHVRRLRRRRRKNSLAPRRLSRSSGSQKSTLPDILDDDEENLDLEEWKPSVYWVMLHLSLVSCGLACSAAAIYASLEGWSYIDALYFSFVSFSTIGFGDYVSTQKPSYPYLSLYHFANFLFLLLGCCSVYSLLNVTSIVLKQGLNYVIGKVQCKNSDLAVRRLPRRRSSVSTIYYSRKRATRIGFRDSLKANEISETPRKMSGELISMKDLLAVNHVSLAVMQKQLYDTAQMQKSGSGMTTLNPVVLKPGAVGPLAIASEKFE